MELQGKVQNPSLVDVRADHPGKSDSEIREIYLYGARLKSIRSIAGLSKFANLQFLSLHNNEITRIEGLELLSSLKEVNLSSNYIRVIEGLSHLSSLRVLNLSCNRLQEITGLRGLHSLSKLVLSHNQIVKLGGLSDLNGPRDLKYLDLKDNSIKSLAELWQLAECIHLEELVLSHGKHTNPVCEEPGYQATVLAALPHLKYLDHQVGAPGPQLAVKDRGGSIPGGGGITRPGNLPPGSRDRFNESKPSCSFAPNEDIRNVSAQQQLSSAQHVRPPCNSSQPVITDPQDVEQANDAHHVDHELKGFVRRRQFEELKVPKDHATRIGRLELHFSELIDTLKSLSAQSEPSEYSTDEDTDRPFRRKSRKIRRFPGRKGRGHGSKRRNEVDSESEDDRINELQTELASLKEELLKRNKETTASPPENEQRTQDKGPQKAEHEQVKEFIELLKNEMRPLGTSIREQVKAKLSTLQSETSALKAETSALKEALDVATCLRQNAERALMDITAEKEALRLSTANLTKTLHEKHANLKLCNTELEFCKRKEVEAYEEVRRLSTLLSQERLERKKETVSLTSLHEEKMREELRDKTATFNSLQRKLEETEHQLQEERIASAERSSRIIEEVQKQCTDLKQALKTVMQKEENAQALVAELSATVQSQNLRVQDLHNELRSSSALQEQTVQELQALRLKENKKAAESEELLRKEIEHLKQQLEASHAEDQLIKLKSLKEENARLHNKLGETSAKLQASEDAIRIKTKMLESQNDTIRELKMEAARMKDGLKEAKYSSEFAKNEWNAKLRDEIEQGQALRKELAAQDAVVMELEEELKTQKALNLEDISRLGQKLKEKDEMLRYVEGEINQVKSLYENREKKIATERDEAVDKLKSSLHEKEKETCVQLDEMTTLKVEFMRKEREYTTRLTLVEEELEKSSHKTLQLENQLQEQQLTMERQKAVSTSKVNQLCKVLDELRATN